MSKIKSHDHNANQRGWVQPMGKPSPSTSKHVGITAPIQKPSPTSRDTSNIQRVAKATSPKSKAPRQAEEATSPGTDTSNRGM